MWVIVVDVAAGFPYKIINIIFHAFCELDLFLRTCFIIQNSNSREQLSFALTAVNVLNKLTVHSRIIIATPPNHKQG